MSVTELQRLENWLETLQEVSETYPGNINLNTVITSIASRIKEYKKKQTC